MERVLVILLVSGFYTLSVGASWSADFQKGLTTYDIGDYATALREWKPLAEQGYYNAQNNLGVMYDSGRGVPQDYKTAVKWYRLAAEQGNTGDQSGLRYARAQSGLKIIKSRLVSKGIDDCLFDEVAKITGPETKRIVEKHCRNKMEKKSLDWLLRKFN